MIARQDLPAPSHFKLFRIMSAGYQPRVTIGRGRHGTPKPPRTGEKIIVIKRKPTSDTVGSRLL